MSKNLTLRHMVAGGIEEAGSSNIGASHHPMVISNGTMTKRIMLDMGAGPSNTFDRSIENPLVDIDIDTLDALFISHVHQDHVGSVIRLVKAGFHGPIYMSERSKALARVIFDDMLKHEKEDVAEHNRKVKNLQQDLMQAWFIVRIHKQAPETRHMKNPHDRIPESFYSVEGLYETKVEELMWKYNVRRRRDTMAIKETLFNRKHNEKLTRHNLENMHWDKEFDKEELIDAFMGLKNQILFTQENFTKLQYDHAKSLLAKYHIDEKEDIQALDRRLEVMAFNENDVMQALGQIHGIKMEEYYEVFPGLLKVKFYNAGHVEGSVQMVGTIYNDKGDEENFMFSGDLGRSKQPGLCGRPAIPVEKLNYVMMEGTYGDRIHDDRELQKQRLLEDIQNSRSMVLLPCFALQRFQEILCMIIEAIHTGKLHLGENEKIYCQSPLAMAITKEYINFDKHGVYKNLTDNGRIEWLTEKEDVTALLEQPGRRIVVCSGGMLEKGTITQYINEISEDKEAKIILTGYQVPGTNGYKILHNDFSEPVRLNNKTISGNNARISTYSFSGHGDHDELMSHFFALNLADNATLTLIHGGDARHTLAKDIDTKWKNDRPHQKVTINVPEKNGEVYDLSW